MSNRITTYRSLHDLGLAAWFGGSLFGVAGLNAAAEEADSQRTTSRITSVGWAKWAPVNGIAVAVHLVGGYGVLSENRKRAVAQKGVAGNTAAKLALTGAALAATAYSRVLGKKVENRVIHEASDASSTSTSHASAQATRSGASSEVGQSAQQADKVAGQALGQAADRLPVDVARAQQQLRYIQFAVPALTGALLVLNAQQGEQQRPGAQLRGLIRGAGSAIGS